MVLGGGEQTAEDETEASQQVEVAPTTRNCTQVIHQDDERPNDEQGKHQDGNPTRTDLDVLGNRRGVTSRGGDAVLIVSWGFGTGLTGTGAFGSRASASCPLWRCHTISVRARGCGSHPRRSVEFVERLIERSDSTSFGVRKLPQNLSDLLAG